MTSTSDLQKPHLTTSFLKKKNQTGLVENDFTFNTVFSYDNITLFRKKKIQTIQFYKKVVTSIQKYKKASKIQKNLKMRFFL